MKVKMLLLGMCMSLVAMYVEAKDTMYVSRQLLGDDIKKVILGNYSNIEITQGDSNCILYYTKRKQNTIPEKPISRPVQCNLSPGKVPRVSSN